MNVSQPTNCRFSVNNAFAVYIYTLLTLKQNVATPVTSGKQEGLFLRHFRLRQWPWCFFVYWVLHEHTIVIRAFIKSMLSTAGWREKKILGESPVVLLISTFDQFSIWNQNRDTHGTYYIIQHKHLHPVYFMFQYHSKSIKCINDGSYAHGSDFIERYIQ